MKTKLHLFAFACAAFLCSSCGGPQEILNDMERLAHGGRVEDNGINGPSWYSTKKPYPRARIVSYQNVQTRNHNPSRFWTPSRNGYPNRQIVASSSPGGPPPGYYVINRTHWARNGTNRLADNKANHHPNCPGAAATIASRRCGTHHGRDSTNCRSLCRRWHYCASTRRRSRIRAGRRIPRRKTKVVPSFSS